MRLRYSEQREQAELNSRIADLGKLMDGEQDIDKRQYYLNVLRQLQTKLEHL